MGTRKYVPGKYFTGEPCKNGHIAERWNYNGMCVECKRAADRPSNLQAGKRYRVKTEYGLSMDQVELMLERQENLCAICKDPFEDRFKTQIDHCHKTGHVRGLLCINCNWMLGKARDNPIILRAGAAYLEQQKEIK